MIHVDPRHGLLLQYSTVSWVYPAAWIIWHCGQNSYVVPAARKVLCQPGDPCLRCPDLRREVLC